MQEEWQRTRGLDEAMPEMSKTLNYLRRMKDKVWQILIKNHLTVLQVSNLELVE